MEQYGNQATYNVETVLKSNIVGSEFYRDNCLKLSTWEEVIDQIFYEVSNVEPWMSGNARGATTAFCLMYRLCTLKPTEEQVQATIEHVDSPYIRAVGFLYLRYVGNPRSLWGFISPFVDDQEEFAPSGEQEGKKVTMGAFVRDIFLEQYYFETIFPRIPKPVHDDFVAKLKAMGLPTKVVGNAGQGGGDRRGVEEPNRRPASVKASLSVALGQRAPNRAAAREVGRGLGAGIKGTVPAGTPERKRSRSPAKKRSRSRERERDERDRHGSRGYERGAERGYQRDKRGDDRNGEQRRDSNYRDEGGRNGRNYDKPRSRDRSRIEMAGATGQGIETRGDDRSGQQLGYIFWVLQAMM